MRKLYIHDGEGFLFNNDKLEKRLPERETIRAKKQYEMMEPKLPEFESTPIEDAYPLLNRGEIIFTGKELVQKPGGHFLIGHPKFGFYYRTLFWEFGPNNSIVENGDNFFLYLCTFNKCLYAL